MNLETWLKQKRPQDEQLRVVEALCTALNDAHVRGVVHPAIEPSNIDLTSEGSVSLAEAVHGVPSASGARYRAPEVVDGGSHSAPADIYAAGVIFYEMLGGRTPAAGAERVASLADVRPDLSRDLTDAVMGCLEKGPDWRPRDLSYLLQVVAQVRGSTPSRATAPRPVRTETPKAVSTRSVASKAPGRSRADSDLPLSAGRDPGGRSSLPMILVAIVVLAGGGVGAWFWLQSQAPSRTPTARPTVTPPPVASAGPAPSSSPTPGGVAAAPRTPPSTAAPTLATATPTSATPTPAALAAMPTPTPVVATPMPVAVAVNPTTAAAVPTPRPTPTPAPVSVTTAQSSQPTTQQPTAPTPTVEPAALTAVTPLTLKRGAQAMIDVRGSALRSDHQLQIANIKERGITVPIRRVKWVDSTLMKVLVEMDPNLPTGQYTVYVVDPQGNATNALLITITK